MTENDAELIRAVKRGDTAEIDRLIEAGADPNCCDSQGWTPLFHAAGAGSTEIMRLLLAHGADIDSHRETGFTPLFSAILSRHLEAIRLLVDGGASVEAPDNVPLARHVPSDWKHREEALHLLRPRHEPA